MNAAPSDLLPMEVHCTRDMALRSAEVAQSFWILLNHRVYQAQVPAKMSMKTESATGSKGGDHSGFTRAAVKKRFN